MVQANPKKQKSEKKSGGCCGGSEKPQQPPVHDPRTSLRLAGTKNVDENGAALRAAKIIFMGEAKVGKTSIIQTFMQGQSQTDNAPTSIVSDFCKRIEVNEGGRSQQLQLNIWDAAGDASVHNLAHLFLRDTQVGVLCYSITSKKSFDKLDEWLDHLE